MKTSDFYYELPEELIAQDPLRDRAASKLMVLDVETGEIEHKVFKDIGAYLRPGDCLVFNDTKVIPARLLGVKENTLGSCEILLLKRVDKDKWECIVKPGKKLREGARVLFGRNDAASAPLIGEIAEVLPDGNRYVRFEYEGIFEEVLDKLGEMPLPPYIKHKLSREDRDYYQTVYAKHEGSAAAPTAGLHFTNELLKELDDNGVLSAFVTLHVGLGTFRPVKVDDVTKHHMHTEYCEISEETAGIINKARKAGGRIICVGTTSVRTLESMTDDNGVVRSGKMDTDIFIYPGYKFKAADCIITNFHLPESTLLMLVSAFAGKETILKAYETAVSERYRFFSFGDAMFLKRESV